MDDVNTGGSTGMTNITVKDPSGAHEILHLFAKRPGSLDGKVIAELAAAPHLSAD